MIDNNDGTITDPRTGLMWEQAGSTERCNHAGAIQRCVDLHLAGHIDWRLPTVQELTNIVDYSRANPAIDPIFETVAYTYWSATTYATFPGNAWGVTFYSGFVGFGYKYNFLYVRAVRTGSSTIRPFDTLVDKNAKLRAQLAEATAALQGLVSARDNAPATLEERTVQSWRQARAFLADLPTGKEKP